MKSNNIKIVSNTNLEQINIEFQNSKIFFVKLPFIKKKLKSIIFPKTKHC